MKCTAEVAFALVRPGDILVLAGRGPLLYRRTDGTHLSAVEGDDRDDRDGLMRLAGQVVMVELCKKAACRWLTEAPESDLKAVRTVLVALPDPGKVDDEANRAVAEAAAEAVRAAVRKGLMRLAKVNPHVAVGATDPEALAQALELLNPSYVEASADLTPEDVDRLAAEPRLETLTTQAERPGMFERLGRLQKLRSLFIMCDDWDFERAPARLPTMPNLERLVLASATMTDLAAVGDQPALRELSLLGCKRLRDIQRVSEMPELRALCLAGCEEVRDLAALDSLRHLTWLWLPPGTTQAQFDHICRTHPDLVLLHASQCGHVADLSAVEALAKLEVLTVPITDFSPLAEQPSLRLLGLRDPGELPGADATEGDHAAKRHAETLVQVMKANPDLVVTEEAPICLGSGWILLLVPAAAGAGWLARRRRRGGAP